MRWRWIVFLAAAAAVALTCQALNVALHAQVDPSSGSIVGSVLTTDGLKAALELRPEVSYVNTYYPFKYEGFFLIKWDLVIMEGWFFMIHEFIHLVRSHSPGVVVLYYCLDPVFPGLDDLLRFDVDGYLTNSELLQAHLMEYTGLPTEYVLLAADPSVMRPNASVAKTYGAVFVGAGGEMLDVKSHLLEVRAIVAVCI